MLLRRDTWILALPLLLAMAGTASANPLGPEVIVGPLLAEAFLVAFLARAFLRDFRIFATWLPVTFGTWVLMIRFLDWMRDVGPGGRLPAYVAAELGVWLLEAGILMLISRVRVFQAEKAAVPLGWGRALVISLVANLVSFLAGLFFQMY